VTLDALRTLIAEVLRPLHFFVGSGIRLEVTHPQEEEAYWEILHGRLLDPPLTTRRQIFEAWHVFLHDQRGRAAEPVLSVRLDAPASQVHVTRSLLCHAWEGYHAGDNVYLSRETLKWLRERVGTIELARFTSLAELRDELICLLFQAVVGVSRLPLTSLEAPLPAFSLGELAYVYRPNLPSSSLETRPMRTFQELVGAFLPGLAELELAKLAETLLHATPAEKLSEAADLLRLHWRALGHADAALLTLLRTLFNEVALSPYTDLVDKALALVGVLEEKQCVTTAAAIDFLAHLLRQIGRHLTAYDLVTFHHRGANYPDALLLDAVLKAYLTRLERRPDLFEDAPGDPENVRWVKRWRRRGLRQGWLLRARYEGHLVPDAPTSEGENARVLPAPHVRVPEDQLAHVQRRRKRLFHHDPLTEHLSPTIQTVLAQSLTDLRHPEELRELGMALFLDRPLGVAKEPLEPDQTLLLSYEAFSRLVAEGRLEYLASDLRLLDATAHQERRLALRDLAVPGVAVASLQRPTRPSLVSVHDARKVAEDFVLLRNTRRTTDGLLEHYDLRAAAKRHGLDFMIDGSRILIVQGFSGETDPEDLTVFDAELRPRVRFAIDARLGYIPRAGVEHPAGGLRLVRVL
jgi:hypothetical protein